MRLSIFIIALMAAASGFAANLAPTLPQVAFLDTETVTNVPIPSLAQDVRKYAFSMSFAGTPSNNVEIAFGAGADGRHELLLCDILFRADGRVREVSFRDGSAPLFPEPAASAKSWGFPSAWNVARLAGRGENIRTGERFSISATIPGFAIRMQ